jgi:tetratricopeptide (TPR) repeat protein
MWTEALPCCAGIGARGRSRGGGPAFFRRPALLRHAVMLLLAAAVLSGCRDAETAMGRGDRLWADSNYTAALAEYRLSYEFSRSDEVLARLAHAYATTGQFERARESYDRLIERAPQHADQAVFDFLALARRAQNRGDRYGMAAATEAALELRPGLPVDDMAAPLARYYARAGDPDRARTFFERALAAAPPDSMAPLLFEFAQFQEARGSCTEAIELFGAFRTRQPRGERADQARWSTGNCAFALARQAQQEGQPALALRHLDVVLELGVPANLLDQAWYERGEALLLLDRRDEALQAYVRVLELVRAPGGQLAERARQRIDQLRFGRDFVP